MAPYGPYPAARGSKCAACAHTSEVCVAPPALRYQRGESLMYRTRHIVSSALHTIPAADLTRCTPHPQRQNTTARRLHNATTPKRAHSTTPLLHNAPAPQHCEPAPLQTRSTASPKTLRTRSVHCEPAPPRYHNTLAPPPPTLTTPAPQHPQPPSPPPRQHLIRNAPAPP